MGWLGYWRGKEALSQSLCDHLTSVRASKANQIESFFGSVHQVMSAFVRDPITRDAARELSAAFDKLETELGHEDRTELVETTSRFYRQVFLPRLNESVERSWSLDDAWPNDPVAQHLQYHYIVTNQNPLGEKDRLDQAADGSSYSEVHLAYHETFRNILDWLPFYDLFFIDARSSAIVYSVFKEVDFGTCLVTGPHRESGLAEVFLEARVAPPGGVVMGDFRRYSPSYAAPACFVAAPIHQDGECTGVVAVQIAIDDIDRVMTGDRQWHADGLGETGETYLVGRDRLMRSGSRGLIEQPEKYLASLRGQEVDPAVVDRIAKYGTTILLREVQCEVIDRAFRGEVGVRSAVGSRGTNVICSYGSVEIVGVDWVILAEKEVAEAFSPIVSMRRRMAMALAIIVAATVIVAGIAAKWLARRFGVLLSGVRQMGRVDTPVMIPIHGRDEFGELALAFNNMAERIQKSTETIQRKNRENEALLLNILPQPIADRLKNGEEPIADAFPSVTVLFADIVGFTRLAETIEASELVRLLNELFTAFDDLAKTVGVEKIKTIGDAYMAVGGVPNDREDHEQRMTQLAFSMLEVVDRFNERNGTELSIRIGLNSGPVVAGVIGTSKFIYDLWGDTVNVASRMESHGVPGRIQVTESVYQSLDAQSVEAVRREVDVKGKGTIVTYLLRDRISARHSH